MFLRSFLLIAATTLLHAWGLFGMYGVWDWYDGIVHTVGGAMSASILYDAWVLWFNRRPNSLVIIFGVLIVGLLWEVHEFVLDRMYPLSGFYRQPSTGDTLLDLVLDLVGAAIVLYVLRTSAATTAVAKTTE